MKTLILIFHLLVCIFEIWMLSDFYDAFLGYKNKGKKRNTYIGSKKNEVIKMLQRGFSNKEIAAQLQVSSQYVSKIKAELSSNV